MNNFEKLKEELASLYLDKNLTDIELNDVTERLIKFFAIGAKYVFQAKKVVESEQEQINPTNH